MLKGAYFHEFGDDHDHGFGFQDIAFPDHHAEDGDDVEGEDDEESFAWKHDNVQLVTVGVDVGSSTSHLLFARLHLQRLSQSLSSRFAVVKREVLHRSPIVLTPYRPDGLIDHDALRAFVGEAYHQAGLTADDIDTGAVILTGAALERANARAVADLFADSGGKFVCASAGHNLEGILACHGSGAVALSHTRGETLLHLDIGGGTTKLGLLRDGVVLQTAAIHVGGRLVALDEDNRVVRIEPSAERVAESLGIRLQLGTQLAPADQRRMAELLVDILLQYARGEEPRGVAREFLLTDPLDWHGVVPDGVTFSGGVSEYVYGRETRTFRDLAPDIAAALQVAAEHGRLPAPIVPLGEGIRATVMGASQFSVQLSGNTVHISNPDVLPLRNLPVVYAHLGSGEVTEEGVERSVRAGFQRLDITEGEASVALAVPWKGEPYYRTLRALAAGIARALPHAITLDAPLVIALDGDIGRSLGAILTEEMGVTSDLVVIDGLQLVELDFVDVGEVIQPANVVPVVVKSLAFGDVEVMHAPRTTGVHA